MLIRSGDTFTTSCTLSFTEDWLFEHFQVRDPWLVDQSALYAALLAESGHAAALPEEPQ